MSYPTFQPNNELGYKIGTFAEFVPPFLSDTVMIRPFGEYGSAAYGVHTILNGGYWLNANSAATDPNSSLMTDIVYLVQNDLAVLPKVKKIVFAVHWYTSDDYPSLSSAIFPVIGPEVVAWNWDLAPPAEYKVNIWNRSNAYELQPAHQVWPTLDDNALINGFQYLHNVGYQVGLCPIATMMSRNAYSMTGGEWEIDRSNKIWSDANLFTQFLSYYQLFHQHYIDLLAGANITPWIMYLGYGMRDITGCGNPSFIVQFVNMLQVLATYCKAKLPNTLTTYAADIDEYFYSFWVRNNQCNLDPLWTCPNLDLIGINWFAPLAVDDTEDNQVLQKGVTQGEGNDLYYPNSPWRGTISDRLISNTTRNFKTGLARAAMVPTVSGVKDIIDWLAFYHYYPAINGVLAGCTPLANLFPGDPRLCSHIYGVGPVGSVSTLYPAYGGIAPIPGPQDTWLSIRLHSVASLALPASIPDSTVLSFDFSFSIDPALTNLAGNYRLLVTAFGLVIDSLAGTITLWLLNVNGSYTQVPLFFAPQGRITLIYTVSNVQIFVDGAFDKTVTSSLGFQMPAASEAVVIGNVFGDKPPAGYGIWQGKIYFLSFIFGPPNPAKSQNLVSGGQFFFDDTYNGIRTAWTPELKPWMATSYGYASVHGSAADPLTRVGTIIGVAGVSVPSWYSDYTNLVAATYRGGARVVNIQGSYGSTFDFDDQYQAIVLNACTLGLLDAGAQHQVAWFMDTRTRGAYLALMPAGGQMFNDAYDYDINSALNGKAAVRFGGSKTIYTIPESIDDLLGLSIIPGELPPQRQILVQPGIPQV